MCASIWLYVLQVRSQALAPVYVSVGGSDGEEDNAVILAQS